MRKVDPDESGSLDRFAFVRRYVDKEVSLNSAGEAERLMSWACNIILIDLQREIFFKIYVLKREQEQESLSLKESSSLKPLSKGRSPKEQFHQSRERKTIMHLHQLKRTQNWSVN